MNTDPLKLTIRLYDKDATAMTVRAAKQNITPTAAATELLIKRLGRSQKSEPESTKSAPKPALTSFFPLPIQNAVKRLAETTKLGEEKIYLELVASMLGSLTEDTAPLAITNSANFTTVDLMKTLQGISDGTLKPVVNYEEVAADLAAA